MITPEILYGIEIKSDADTYARFLTRRQLRSIHGVAGVFSLLLVR